MAELCDVLANASRADAKRIKDQIATVRSELGELTHELEKIED
jgi:hypothetical protein